jgi:hypothetical protein
MVLIDEFGDRAVDRYADALTSTANALAREDISSAAAMLAPIAGELWNARVPRSGPAGPGSDTKTPRRVPEIVRARVFLRDGFRCQYCGGRTIPRCILVAISDVFPAAFAYDPHYGRARIHPAFWVLAAEADHVLAHSRGGGPELDNLTTLHAACNTRKSDALREELPQLQLIEESAGWDGLLSTYPAIVKAGDTNGARHSAAEYHPRWMRYFDLNQVPQPALDGGD